MMFTDSAPSACPPSGGDADREELRVRLWAQVRAAFPDMAGGIVRLEEDGGDHLVLIVDEARIVRFPRPGRHGPALEMAVLRRLLPHARIAVPDYDMVDPDGLFAGYPLIPGVPLTPSRFHALPADAAATALAAAATLLASLHGLDPESIAPLEAWPRLWTAARFADRIERDFLPVLARRAPALVAPVERFVRRYREDRAPRDVVLHGDLTAGHLLLDERTGRLAGIIDFGDVALGDPAHDFLGFWAYGADAAAIAADRYAPGDPALLARSRRHFVRHRIDRLFDAIVEGAPDEVVGRDAAAIGMLLADR